MFRIAVSVDCRVLESIVDDVLAEVFPDQPEDTYDKLETIFRQAFKDSINDNLENLIGGDQEFCYGELALGVLTNLPSLKNVLGFEITPEQKSQVDSLVWSGLQSEASIDIEPLVQDANQQNFDKVIRQRLYSQIHNENLPEGVRHELMLVWVYGVEH